jgi:hypothetical protein
LELMRLTLTGTYVAFANDGEQLARIAAPSDPRPGSR